MRCSTKYLVLALFALISGGTSTSAAEPTLRSLGQLQLSVDRDLDIQPATDGELIKWPIVADWDSEGRLVVAECGGVGKPIAEHNKQLLHRIVRLVDTNKDGKFDKRIVAASELAFPEGVLCVGNSILVSAPPEIWKLTDADNDGVCEQREIWYNPGTITGCANDLHGPYMGRDGWIYWCKGAFAEQHHELLNGEQLTTKAAHVFRRRLEGGPVEPVMTGGMDNPVEVAISHTGERFFTSTFLQRPGDGRRDGIAHAVYGGVYGKVNDVLNGHPRTGDLMPIMTHLGPAAPSGLICLESERLLGPAVGGIDTLVAAQFNFHKVTAHTLVPRGAGFVTEDRQLVSSERIDFHPTDVIEAPDGSLLVIDTGGWYNLCCPSSHVDQSIASGGIYRLTSSTTRTTAAPLQKDWNGLTLQQANELIGDAATPVRDRQQALWRVCRLAGEKNDAAEKALISALSSTEASLRQIAAHSVSVHRLVAAKEQIQRAMAGESNAATVRSMAEALGRLGDKSSVPAIFETLAAVKDDRMLEHSLIYALMELKQPEALVQYLTSKNPIVSRGAMIALDQSGNSELLKRDVLIECLTAFDPAMRKTATEILARHSQWAAGSEGQLNKAWDVALSSPELRADVASVIGAWASNREISNLILLRINRLASGRGLPTGDQVEQLVDMLAGVRGQKLSMTWLTRFFQLMKLSDEPSKRKLADWLASLKVDPSNVAWVNNSLSDLLKDVKEPETKLQMISAMVPRARLADQAIETLVIDHFLGAEGEEYVPLAGKALSRIALSAEGSQRMIAGLGKVQPLELMIAVSSIADLGQDELDGRLLDQLSTLPAARTLAFEQLTSQYRNRSEALRKQVQTVVETLSKPPADVEAKLDELLSKLKSGDPARGFQVFRSTKAACSACHRIGYVGGTVGPELTRIGTTRSRRALLEAVVFPNARLEQSYTPMRVLTTDGRVFNGLIHRQTDKELELITGANQSVVIVKADIQQQQASQTSIMPAGLEQQLTLDELADLLALLEAAGR